MKRKTIIGVISAAAVLAAGRYVYSGMGAAEVLRKLSGMRLSTELFRQGHGRLPYSFAETLRAGSLEEVPRLKLRWHPARSSVRDTPSMSIRDTGAWAYVNDPASPQYGLLYIDCAHRDEKGRFWSEF